VATMPKFVVTFSQNPVNLGSLHSLSYLRSVDNLWITISDSTKG